jgi:hypothetical protein
MKTTALRLRRPLSKRNQQRGVALVIVIIFMGLILLLGLASTMTSITEVNVGRNVRLATEAFNAADAGAAHAFNLVDNMNGDFTHLLLGEDETVKTGDEFAQSNARVYANDHSYIEDGAVNTFDDAVVAPIPLEDDNPDGIPRALVQIDPTHFYELIVYDDAGDDNSYLFDSDLELAADPDPNTRIFHDGNSRVLIRSIGYVMSVATTLDGFQASDAISSAVVDVVIGLNPYPAVISNDDLQVLNSVEIGGALGSVHANDDLALPDSGNYEIEQSATYANLSGDTPPTNSNLVESDHVGGFVGLQGEIYLPDLNPMDYATQVTHIFIQKRATAEQRTILYNKLDATAIANAFTAAGYGDGLDTTYSYVILKTSDTPTYSVVARDAANNFDWQQGSGSSLFQVRLANDGGSAGDCEVRDIPDEGVSPRVSMFALLPQHGNSEAGFTNGQTGRVTIITNGSIKLRGDAKVQASITISTPEQPPWHQIPLVALAGMDVVWNGNAGANQYTEGLVYAHEQFDLQGTGVLYGQMVGYEKAIEITGGNYVTSSSVKSTTSSPVGVGASAVRSNFEIYHNTAQGYLGNFAQAAWRQLRDFDPVENSRPAP